MASRYHEAFRQRTRQRVEIPGGDSFDVWCAHPEDVVFGKLMAWAERRSRKHETDILEILVFHYRVSARTFDSELDESYIDKRVGILGSDAVALWGDIKKAAKQEARQ